MINENLQDMNLWHVSKSKITSLRKTPMFFALEKSHSIGWYKSALNDGADTAYMYKATLKPNAVIVTYKELKQILSLPNDNDYIEMLVSNPSSSEILSNKITKAAIKNGIDGITYLDYDPRDFSKDLEAVILFNPKKSLSSIEEEPIKSSNRKASNEPSNSAVNTLKKVVDIFKKKYKNIEADYDSGYMGKQAFRMYVDNFINGGELQVAYQYKNHILSVFIPGVLGTKELAVDIENISPMDIVNKITAMTDVSESFLKRINNLEKLTLEYRVRKLESLLLEAKKDQEILNNFLGDDYYNKYQLIKNKIKDPEYKDIYKIIKMDPDEVKAYIDNFQSNTDIRRSRKSEGAKLIYQDDLWKVYRITTYKAAQLYGSGTTWCITGRYDGHEERGEEYFNDYIEENYLDGGYYFYIKNDNKTKYCLLRREHGEIHSIWNAEDNSLNPEDILTIEPDFPTVPDIFIPPQPDGYPLFKDSITIVHKAIENGADVNERCIDKSSQYYGYTPLDWQLRHNQRDIVDLLLDNGAKITKTFPWQAIINWFSPSLLKKVWDRGLNKIADLSEMLVYTLNNAGVDALKMLLKLGNVDVNAPLSDGKSLLYHEITNKYGARVGAIRELIKYGADVNEVLDNGETLLDLAKRAKGSNRSAILDLLK